MTLRQTFFYAVLLFIGGVFLALKGYLSGNRVLPVLLAGLCMPVLTLAVKKHERFFWHGGLLLFLFAAGLFAGSQGGRMAADSMYRHVGKNAVVTGKVEPGSWRDRDAGYSSFLLEARYVTLGGKTTPASGRLQVTVSSVPQGERLPSGAIVSLAGEIKALRGFANPGGYDIVAREYRQDIYGRLAAKYQTVALSGQIEAGWGARIEAFLAGVKAAMQKRMPPEDQAVIFGMLFGGYDDLAPEVVRDFSTTGIVHILSVSGTHVAMVAGAIFWLAKRLRLGGRKAAVLAITGIAVYSALSGFAIPVVRSAVMGIAILAGLAMERRAHTASILGAVALLMLLFQPRWLLDIGFQLSFGATAGIVFLYQPLKERLVRLPDFLGAPLALTLAVQIAVLPFLAGYFYQVSLLAFLSNIIILPLAEFCLLVALLGVVVNLAVPVAGGLLLVAASLLLGTVLRLNSWLAGFDFAVLSIPALPFWWWVCYYITVLVLFDFLPFKLSLRARGAVVAGVLAISIFAGFLIGAEKEFAAHFIDVGQGDACLIVTPGRRAVLIDAGPRSFTGDYDTGERVIAPYLRYYGLKQVDLLIISHGHSDHAGGSAAVARQVPVKAVWLPAGDTGDDIARMLLQLKDNTNKLPLTEGLAADLDGLRLEVVSAPQITAHTKKRQETSAVIKVAYGGKSFLFTGDADKAGELAIVPKLDKINVLKVSHHGGATSSDPLFIGKADPDIAVISVGVGNSYGHPARVTLDTIARQGSKVLRTDEQGAVMIKIKEDKLVWYGYKENPAAF